MDYLKLLNRGYENVKSWREAGISKLEYLSTDIFNFTTYDGEMDELFAKKALEVCTAITRKQTFEYQKDPENYKWYLIMCNMPFFSGKLEWGTSIRGAWWNLYNGIFKLESCGLFDEFDEQLMSLTFDEKQWNEFIKAMNDFVTNA